MSYFGIKRPKFPTLHFNESKTERATRFCKTGEIGYTLGDRIRLAREVGADIGVRVIPNFDNEGEKGVDIMASPNTDFFDVADAVGAQAAQLAIEQPTPVNEGENGGE